MWETNVCREILKFISKNNLFIEEYLICGDLQCNAIVFCDMYLQGLILGRAAS